VIFVHLVAFDIEVSVARCLHQEVATDHAHPEVAIVVVIDLEVDRVVVVAVADEVADVTIVAEHFTINQHTRNMAHRQKQSTL